MKSALARDQSPYDMNTRSSVQTGRMGSSGWFVLLGACGISLMTSAVILTSDAPSEYANLAFLPLTFLLLSILYFKLYFEMQKNIAILLILAGYFVRDVVTPLALALGDYATVFRWLSSANINAAIFLMMYEAVIVFTGMSLYVAFGGRRKATSDPADCLTAPKMNYRWLNAILVLCVVFCIGVFLYIPEIRGLYKPMFGNSRAIASIDYTFDEIALRGSAKRVLFSLFTYVLGFIRYVVPAYLIYAIYRKKGDSSKGLILSALVLVLPFLVVGESNIEPFLGLLLNIVLIRRLYPSHSRHLARASWILGGVLVISVFSIKMSMIAQSTGASGFQSVSEALNAYFPGVGNAAATYNIVDANPMKTLFYDFYSIIPFRGSLFGLEGTTLTDLFAQSNGVWGNIVPCISQAMHYLGTFLAPLVPVSVAVLSLVMHEMAESTHEYWRYFYFAFIMVFSALVPTTYNLVTLLAFALEVFLPIWILTRFVSRRRS